MAEIGRMRNMINPNPADSVKAYPARAAEDAERLAGVVADRGLINISLDKAAFFLFETSSALWDRHRRHHTVFSPLLYYRGV